MAKSPSGGCSTPAAAGLFTPDGALLHLHQVILGKACVMGWEPTPRAGWLLLPSFPEGKKPSGGDTPCQRQELTAPISQPAFISPPKDLRSRGAVGRIHSSFRAEWAKGLWKGGCLGATFVQKHPNPGSFSDALLQPLTPECPQKGTNLPWRRAYWREGIQSTKGHKMVNSQAFQSWRDT